MPVHRICCCTEANTGIPVLVRAGWYHFLVMGDDGSVASIIGQAQRVKYDAGSTYWYNGSEETDANGWCSDETIPNVAPVGHPLAVPSTIKTSTNPSGKTVKDIGCGAYHNIVRCSDGTIACWGLNAMGQCNVPTTSSKGNLTDPTNPNLKGIVGLHAGYSNTAVSFSDGTIVCWGDPEVADVVNAWTDIMMSPINITADAMGYANTDNVDVNNQQYAKPAYTAAYNTTGITTWNLNQDPNQYWHGANAVHPRWSGGTDQACVPFFDLGVETNPTNPLEFKLTNREYYLPGTGTQFPHNWFGAANPPCDSTCMTTNPQYYKEMLSQWWRWLYLNDDNDEAHSVGGEAGALAGIKSCCDLEIKKDFAVAMRRTGQIITSRTTNRVSPCPSGVSCRDCTADSVQDRTSGNGANWRSGCGLDGDPCTPATCACCNGGYYSASSCPDCSNTPCDADVRFVIPSSICVGGTVPRFYEGVGCVSSFARVESLYYNPNWARASALGMFEAGEQVRYGSGRTTTPAANATGFQQNWGWSTIATADLISQDTSGTGPKCSVVHNPANNLTCDQLCKSEAAYVPSTINPQGIAAWQYPVQMWAQSLVAGTNASGWTSNAFRYTTGLYPAICNSCNYNPNDQCADDLMQRTFPNGGAVSFGVIYSGTVYGGATALSVDKYGHSSTLKVSYGGKQPCADFSDHLYAFATWKYPSKPWGPYCFVLSNGVGTEKGAASAYPQCYCQTESGEYCGDLILPIPEMLQVIGDAKSEYLDPILRTVAGFPKEANMRCGEDNYHTGCNAKCSRFSQDHDTLGAIPAFCVENPVISYASTRMAFAMIRTDHRVLGVGGARAIPNDTGNFPPDDSYPDDPSQIYGCSGSTPQSNGPWVLHIWGSLWDPCPPWPRTCDCSAKASVPDPAPEGCSGAPSNDSDYMGPCDYNAGNPQLTRYEQPSDEYGWVPGGGTHPEWGPCARYPKWVRTATVNRSSRQGYWSSGTWTYAGGSPTCETGTGVTYFCPDCDAWTLQYYDGGVFPPGGHG